MINKSFSKLGTITIILIAILALSCFATIFVQDIEISYADSKIGFDVYSQGTKVDYKDGEYFVFGNSSDLKLVLNAPLSSDSSLSVTSGSNDYPLESDRMTVDLSSINGIVTIDIVLNDGGKSVEESFKVSVGWVESGIVDGVYYLPLENGWRKTDDGLFLSQESDRLTASSMRLVTKNVDYLKFSSVCVEAAGGWGQNTGVIKTDTNSFNVPSTIAGSSSLNSNNYRQGAFVLKNAFDVVTINYNPQSSGSSTNAEMRISNLTSVKEESDYCKITVEYNDTWGNVYYLDSSDNRVVLKNGENQVLKYLSTPIYMESGYDAETIKVFDFSFTCGTTSHTEKSFEDGVDSYNFNAYITDESKLSVNFLALLYLPTNSMSLLIKQNGVTRNLTVNNGGVYEFDKYDTVELTLSAPVIDIGEQCDLYIDGVLKGKKLTSAQGQYVYAFGTFDYDHTFTFVYSKDTFFDTKFEYTINKITKSTIEEDLIAEGSTDIEITNDADKPFAYYSPVSTEKIAYVPGNKGIKSSMSVISFEVSESGSFVFDYYMDIDDYSYCLISVNTRLELNGIQVSELSNYYIGEAYDEYDLDDANHGTHGWRRRALPIEVSEGSTATVYIYYLKTNSYDSYVDPTQDLFAISGVAYYVGNAKFTASTDFDEFGSFTAKVDGSVIESGNVLSVGTTINLEATPNAGKIFYGWVINGELVSTDSKYSFIIVGDTVVEAVMQLPGYYVAKTTSGFYTTLNEAVANTISGQVILINDAVISEDLSIPQGVEILIPYSAKDKSGYGIGGTSQCVSWATEATRNRYLYLTVTVNEGVSVVVYGKITLGAVLFTQDQSAQGHTSGAYSHIVNNGSIELRSGAYLDVLGLITGSGSIDLQDGTILRMPFIVNNYAGGTITLHYYEANCFPFYNYGLMNVQCNYTLRHGAKLIGRAALFALGSINTQDVVVINSIENKIDGADGSLYWLTENSYIDLSYDPKPLNVQMGEAHLEDCGVTTLAFHGEVWMGEFSMQGFGSMDMILGLPYTLNYIVTDGATLVIPEDREYMLLPGSEMSVNKGGTLQINGGLYVLDSLLLGPLANKHYPYAEMLRKDGFAVSGMFINNSIVNIEGAFAGIIQSSCDGAVINVGPKAILKKNISMGAYYADEYNNVNLDIDARVQGLGSGNLEPIEKGTSYQSYSIASGTSFVLESFTMNSAEQFDNLTIELNQKMQGYFAKLVDGVLYVQRELYIGEKVANVVVIVDGVSKMSDSDGLISVWAVVNGNIEYQAKLFDKSVKTVNEWNSLDTIILNITKSISVDEDSTYRQTYDNSGAIIQDLDVKATVLFYNGNNESIHLTPSALGNSYVQNVLFTSADYVIEHSHDVYIHKTELSKHISNVESLVDATSENLITKAQSLYAEYQSILSGLTTEELTFVNDAINSKIGELIKYREIIVSFTVSDVTYGDSNATAEATLVNGDKRSISVRSLNEYSMLGGNIVGKYEASNSFNGIDYTVHGSVSGVKQKALKVIIDDKESVYGSQLQPLTADVDGLLEGDAMSDVFELVKANGENAGIYTITAQKTGGNKSSYYSLNATNGTYTITAKPVSVSISSRDVLLAKANSEIVINADFGSSEAITLTYEVYKDNVKVASVINGVLRVDSAFVVGEYEIRAINSNKNYALTQLNKCTYSVVDNKDYYIIDIGLSTLSKVYDGVAVELNVSVKNAETEQNVAYTVTVDGSTEYSIKNVGTYVISVTAEGFTKNYTYSVTPKTVSVVWSDTAYYYNGLRQYPEATVSGAVEGDSVSVSVDGYTNAGKCNVKAVLNDSNYVLDATANYEFEILPKDSVLTVGVQHDIMLSSIYDGAKLFFTVTQSASSISASNIEYEAYDSNGKLAFSVDSERIVSVKTELVVGKYTIKAINKDTNYNVTCVSAELSVVEDNSFYSLDVKFDGSTVDEKVYDGQSVSVTAIVTVTETGEIVNDVAIEYLVGESIISNIKSVSDYTIRITVNGETEYMFNYRVIARTVSIEWSSSDMIYDGNEQIPEYRLVNVVDGDSVTADLGEFECIEEGTHTASVVSISGSDSANYKLASEGLSYEYVIKAANAEVSFVVNDVLYTKVSETIKVESSSYQLSNSEILFEIVKNGVKVGSVKNGVVTLDGDLELGSYELRAVSLNHNYVVVSESKSFNVISHDDYYTVELGIYTFSKTYDGKAVTLRVKVRVSATGSVVSHTLTVNGSADYSIKNAGDYSIMINVLGGQFEYSYTIEQKSVNLRWSASNFVYNGEKQMPTVEITNKVSGDDVSVVQDDYECISAGNKTASVKELAGADKDNYVLNNNLTYQYNISKLTINVTVSDAKSVYGDSDATLSATISESIPDPLNSIIVLSRKVGVVVGEYAINVECIDNNYTVKYNTAKYVIEPKPIRVLIDKKTSVYGEELLSLTATVEGNLVYEDKAENIYELVMDRGINVGEYSISGRALNSNYSVEFVNAVYTITPKKVEFTVGDKQMVYGSEIVKVDAELSEGYTLGYKDVIGDIIEVVREEGNSVGTYKITVVEKGNSNYMVSNVVYTNPEYSVYSITKRPITVTLTNKSSDNKATYQQVVDILNNDPYRISGTVIDGDDLKIEILLMFHQNDEQIVMTKDNFDDHFYTGEFTITLRYDNDNYDITIVEACFTVTKSIVGVVGIETEFIYNDGDVIEVFDWTKNITGNLKEADNNSFSTVITDEEGNVIENIVNVGVYKVKVIIVHSHLFIFDDDVVTDYTVIVSKKNISDKIVAVNIPASGETEYDPFPNSVYAECEIKGVDVEYEILFNNEAISGDEFDVGMYTLKAKIVSANYEGELTSSWKVVPKDISGNINILGVKSDSINIIGTFDIKVMSNSKVNIEEEIFFDDEKVETIDKSGVYTFKAIVDSTNYTGSKAITFEVIKNYIDVFDNITLKLDGFEDMSINEKLETLSAVRRELQKIDESDRAKLSEVESYANVVEQTENAFETYHHELSKAVSTAKHGIPIADTMALISAISVIAYFGIKQTL